MPGITEDVFIRTMSIDYDLVQKLTNIVADLLDNGNEIRVTTDLVTDLTFSINGRKARGSIGILVNPGD